MLIDSTVPELTVSMIYFFSYWVTTAYSSWYVSMILAADSKHVRSSQNQLSMPEVVVDEIPQLLVELQLICI